MDGAPRQHYGLTLAVLVVGALAYALSQTLVIPARHKRRALRSVAAAPGPANP
jgi:hypothetical protein